MANATTVAPTPAPNQTMFREKDKGKPSQEFATWMQSITDTVQSISSTSSLTNTRSSHTGPYTIVNTDKGSTIALSGTGATSLINTLTFGPASGYDANFMVMVLNEDSRGWAIALSGQPTFTLWPGQSKIVFNQNNIWHWTPLFERWRPAGGSFQFNVDPIGNDANDGLGTGTGAKKTVLSAWNDIISLTDSNAEAIIQLLPGGAFGPFGELDGDRTTGFGRLIEISGDPNLINPPIITVPAGGTGIVLRDGGWATIIGLAFVASGSGATAVTTQQRGLADLQFIKYGAFPGGFHIDVADGSECNVTNAEIIVGAASSHWRVEAQSKLVVGSVSINGGLLALNWATGFILGTALSRIVFGTVINFSQCGNYTGGGYALSRHSILESNGTGPPGGAGSADGTSNFY